MLRQGQYNGYIGKAELSKNCKKNKSTFLFNIFKKNSTWRPVELHSAGLHVEISAKMLKKMVL